MHLVPVTLVRGQDCSLEPRYFVNCQLLKAVLHQHLLRFLGVNIALELVKSSTVLLLSADGRKPFASHDNTF